MLKDHIEEAKTEALFDDLMELVENAANGNIDLEKIDTYLTALDKKEPLLFKADTEASLTKFHNKHGQLIAKSFILRRRNLIPTERAN